MNKKRKIVIYLFIITIIFLFADVLVRSIFTEKKVTTKEFYPNEINRIFLSCLEDFGINEDHVKEKKVKLKDIDTSITNYIIDTPKDLKMVEFISSLNEILYYDGIEIKSKELKINKDTELFIERNGALLFMAKFIFNDKFIRTENRFSIIVDGLEDLGNDEIKQILDIPADICFAILPSVANEEILDDITSHGKYYAIKIDDGIDDPIYIMNEDQHPEKIIKSLSNIFRKFSLTNFILINDNSDFFKSTKFKVIEKNTPSGFIVKKVSELINLGDREPKELASLFRFYAEKADSAKKCFYFNTSQFFSIKNDLLKLKKKGNIILSPSKLYEINY
jgi:hypothetical protein